LIARPGDVEDGVLMLIEDSRGRFSQDSVGSFSLISAMAHCPLQHFEGYPIDRVGGGNMGGDQHLEIQQCRFVIG
jgi:hypothetical protein